MQRDSIESIGAFDGSTGSKSGSGIGWARWEKDPTLGAWRLRKCGLVVPEHCSVSIERRIASQVRQLWELTAENEPFCVERIITESPWEKKGKEHQQANNALWRILGAIEAIAAMRGIEFRTVVPQTWRSKTCGLAHDRPGAKQRAMAYAVQACHAPTNIGPDEGEAVCIGQYAVLEERGLITMRKGSKSRR